MDTATFKTRLLVLLDTHGMEFDPAEKPLLHADVAIHCGDLTDGSKLDELRTTINLFKDIDEPWELAIASNRDFTLDDLAFQNKVDEVTPPLDPQLVEKEYDATGEVRRLWEGAKDVGIILPDEGAHHSILQNGAHLTLYASPYSPSLDHGRNFAIQEGVDVVVTHRPPQGIMDYTHGRERAGCADLFTAVAQVRPRVHCFGHFHEGWRVRLVTWRDTRGARPTHFTAIDNNRSHVIE
ncbi:uncharacterized protein Z519_12576 [Cladophialophora bantiana CBS 173.52]|uniref:Calcineurin-like phosphoesterase domain-containing protein n=1 Tax=Cladophialophora bantiana (strain ATCC 10958 / CBS 173.52 / CDC B-1940 / NIH 8579) TaxID=1442370 RepID=A0A0D2H7D1_CLAB1|nr:uncharacterized protein Z519_12576 [Cladophialophora bantiana CBS 173.52]KIW86790.1 hypothetical protein Z519_12576 [Cladophialophora bantiana CBS 173.52]